MKTDWDIIRGLADYIMTFGENKHTKFTLDGEIIEWLPEGDYINLYVDGDYVHADLQINGETETIVVSSLGFSTPDLGKGQNMSDLKMPDVKKLDKMFREALKPLEANMDKIRESDKKVQRDRLVKQLEALDE